MAFRIEGALRFPTWSPTPREAGVWVVKPLRGEWQVLQATELSAETRFSSNIMSPSLALASVIGLFDGLKDYHLGGEKRDGGRLLRGHENRCCQQEYKDRDRSTIHFGSNDRDCHRIRGRSERT